MSELTTAVYPIFLNVAKWGLFLLLFAIIVAIGIFVVIQLKRRKWHVELWEQKADLTLHKIKDDILIEKKLSKGTITVYWLQKSKVEVVPPPTDCVYRWKNKDYVKYIRIERDYIPIQIQQKTNYCIRDNANKIGVIYDKILLRIRKVKTSLFNSEAVRDRFIYIPSSRTLSNQFVYRPIDYDMSMMAQNKIEHADEFFKMRGEWWAKYGAYVLFGVTIVFLIIITALTYEFIAGRVGEMINTGGQVSSALEKVADGLRNTQSAPLK